MKAWMSVESAVAACVATVGRTERPAARESIPNGRFDRARHPLVKSRAGHLYFRGMMARVGQALPAALVLVLTAAAFSAWHIGTPAYLPHTFALGLAWGALAFATKRLAPSIVAHTAANAGFGVLSDLHDWPTRSKTANRLASAIRARFRRERT
jgi:hypothetical protein